MNTRKLMIIIIVLLIVLGGGGLIAYHYLDSNFDQIGKILRSSDGDYSVSVPLTWKQDDDSSNKTLIAARSDDENMYMRVTLDTNSENQSSIEDYVNSYIDTISQRSDDSDRQVVVVSPEKKKIDGHNGYYFEIESVSEGMNLHLWSYCCAVGASYIHVDVSAPRNEIDVDKDIAKGIISSLDIK